MPMIECFVTWCNNNMIKIIDFLSPLNGIIFFVLCFEQFEIKFHFIRQTI